jgi:hypothetical protein
MANRYAVQTGNWSDTATWDGGTLPQAGDVVRPNGFVVTIDQNVTVDELTNNASAPAVAGGSFELLSGVTLNANIIGRVSTTTGMLVTNYGSGTATINGNIFPNVVLGISGRVVTVNGAVDGVLVVNGNISFPDFPTGASKRGNVMVLNGNGNGFKTVFNGTITGADLQGTVASDVSTVVAVSDYILELNGIVSGKISGTHSQNAAGIRVSGSNCLLINNGLLQGGDDVVRVNTGPALLLPNNTNNEVRHYGVSIAASENMAISGGLVTLYDGCSIIDNVNQIAHSPKATRFDSNFMDAEYEIPIDALTSKSFLTAGLLTGYPLEADVEDGVTYGPVGEFTGTLDPVVIDTAQLASDLLNEISSSSNPLAERLRNVSTVQTTGTQLNTIKIS